MRGRGYICAAGVFRLRVAPDVSPTACPTPPSRGTHPRGAPQEEVPWPAGTARRGAGGGAGGSPQTRRIRCCSGPVLNWSDVLQQYLAIRVSSCGSSRREVIRQLFLLYGCAQSEHFQLKRGLGHGSAHCTKDMFGVSGGSASLR